MALSSFSVSAKGLDGIPYRVDVGGGGTAVTGGQQFLVIEGGEEQDKGLDPIWPKRLRLFMREGVDLSPLFGQADRAVSVQVYDVTGGTDTLVYRGFMVTDFYSDAPFEAVPLIELQALDGLGTLENDSLSALYSGGTEVSVQDGITSILSTLYPMEVEVGTEWYPDAGGALTSSDNPLANISFATDNYREERPDGEEFQSQLSVLRDLCIGQGLVVKQVERSTGARWLVAQRSAYNSDGTLKVWTYDTSGSLKSAEPSTRDRSLTLDVNGRDLLKDHTREFVRRRQTVQVTHDFVELGNIISEPGFDSGGTSWQIGSAGDIDAQVISNDKSPDADPSPPSSQDDPNLLSLSSTLANAARAWPVSQNVTDINELPPGAIGRLRQFSHASLPYEKGVSEAELLPRLSVDGTYYLTEFTADVRDSVNNGSGSLPVASINRPIPEGARLPIAPKPSNVGGGDDLSPQAYITLSEPAQKGDTTLFGDISAEVSANWQIRYAGFVNGQDHLPLHKWRSDATRYGAFEVFFAWEDPNGNPLTGSVEYEIGGSGNTDGPTALGTFGLFDDVQLKLEANGRGIDQTITQASVSELGEDETQTARTLSGPTDQNLARLRGNGFEPTSWGLNAGGASLSLAELKARERLRYWRNHNEMFSVTGVDRNGTTQLTGDELVTLGGQTYTVHSIKYDAAKGETELTLIEYEDRGTSGITLETVLEQSEGASGGTSGGSGAVGGGGGGTVQKAEIGSFRPGALTFGNIVLSHVVAHEWQINSVIIKVTTAPGSAYDFDVDVGGTVVTVTLPGGQSLMTADIGETISAESEVRVTAKGNDTNIEDIRTTLDVS